jgi:hypothetical protein
VYTIWSACANALPRNATPQSNAINIASARHPRMRLV